MMSRTNALRGTERTWHCRHSYVADALAHRGIFREVEISRTYRHHGSFLRVKVVNDSRTLAKFEITSSRAMFLDDGQ